ncbi:MAG: hypothetical protein MJY99_10710 [Fibrobacter sp.]|nr:hypothetical protein [Fibrobacter sp.]
MPGSLLIHYGLPGTGKSLFATMDIICPCVRSGRPFFTNITGISKSGLASVCNVHQSEVKYYPVENISDVIRYFDDGDLCHDGVFILDEMKDFVDNEKAISWLESRINVMRKQCVDFVLIAQLPEKEYIHPHLMELAESSNVFVSRKKKGDLTHVDEYFIDGGEPRIVNRVPRNSAGQKRRFKDPLYFSCYKTSESAFYNGGENTTFNGLIWYKTRKFKLFVFLGLILVFVLVFLVVGFLKLKDIGGTIGNASPKNDKTFGAVSSPFAPGSSASLESEQIKELCFKYFVCDSVVCRTDFGIIPLSLYDPAYNLFYLGGGSVRKCPDSYTIPKQG